MQLSSSKVKDKSITELHFIFIHVSHLQRMSSQKFPKVQQFKTKLLLLDWVHLFMLFHCETPKLWF